MGTIEYEEFVTLSKKFVELCDNLGEIWEVRGSPDKPPGLYLVKRIVQCGTIDNGLATNSSNYILYADSVLAEDHDIEKQCHSNMEDFSQTFLQEISNTNETEDEIFSDISSFSSVMSKTPASVYTVEFHVIYSLAHAVPTLYLNAWYLSGCRLTLDEIKKHLIPKLHSAVAVQYDSFGEQDHPVLGQPYFVLHPCRTAQLMATLIKNTRTWNQHSYLISWLAMFAPVVGLKIPINLFTIGIT